MPDTMDRLDTEQQTSIRAHYVTGHFAEEEALARIRFGGFFTLDEDRAAEVLAAPITPAVVKEWTGKDVTEEQIAARLAEVSA